MPQLAPFVYQSTTSTGTGNLALQAEIGFREAAGAFGTGSGNTFGYYVRHPAKADEWEYGTGYVNTSGELVRSSVNVSSAGAGTAVSFSSGTKVVVADVEFGELSTAVTHPGATNNPHSVTAGQVGLPNVPNEDATDPANWDYALTGADTNVVTGTAGASGNLLEWNADGDAVDSGQATSGIFTSSSDVDHDSTTNFVSNEHIDHSGVSISAGTAMTGGGDLTSSRTLNVDAGTGSSQVPQNSDLGTQAYNDQHIASSSQNTNNGDVTYVV